MHFHYMTPRPCPSTRTPALGVMKLKILVDPALVPVIITIYSVCLIYAKEYRRFLKEIHQFYTFHQSGVDYGHRTMHANLHVYHEWLRWPKNLMLYDYSFCMKLLDNVSNLHSQTCTQAIMVDALTPRFTPFLLISRKLSLNKLASTLSFSVCWLQDFINNVH